MDWDLETFPDIESLLGQREGTDPILVAAEATMMANTGPYEVPLGEPMRAQIPMMEIPHSAGSHEESGGEVDGVPEHVWSFLAGKW